MAKSTSTASTASTITVPAFPGKALIKAQSEYDKASEKIGAKFSDTARTIFNGWIDSVRATGLDRSEAGCAALRKAFLEQDDIARAVREELLDKATVGNYAQGAMRAFYHGLEWSPRAFQGEDKGGLPALPWSKKAPAGKAKAKTEASKAAADKSEPASAIGAPNNAHEARKFVRGQLNTLVMYGNKHAKVMDLPTRDVLARLGRLIATLDKVDAAAI
jgi:hypothetical protein